MKKKHYIRKDFKCNMKKLLILLILLIIPSVFADGVIIDNRGYFPENQQLAAINYKDGRENLIISIQTDQLRSNKAAWIFPVPSSPDKTIIDIVPIFPQFGGFEVTAQAESLIEKAFRSERNSQIYPIIFYGFYRIQDVTFAKSESEGLSAIKISGGEVTVYETIEKDGVTT